ncbi:MAG: caspase family protein [Proteobacteria bacterium]|nr:caspase family protein [Pseudomonadota bacterium]
MILAALTLFALAGPTVISADQVDEQQAEALLRGRRLALVVGPSSFTEGFAPLRFTDDDASALGEVLADPAHGQFDEVWSLTSPGDTTLASTRSAMRALGEQSTSPDDTVVVYFSTHGTLEGTPRQLSQYLVLSDTAIDDVARTALPHDEVLLWLDALPSRRKVLVLATCHSGQGKSAFSPGVRALADSTKGALVTPLRDVSEATVIIGVCAFDETARESEQLGHDIYTAFFLDALRDGDANGDGAVTITEAHSAAREQTWAFTEGTQRPYARAEILGEDPIVLTGERVRAGKPSLGSYLSEYVGYSVFVDGQSKGVLPGEVTLDEGNHLVEVQAPGRRGFVARQRVRLRAGTRTDLNTLVRQDTVRFAFGGGGQWFSEPMRSAPVGRGELHVPWLPGRGWELIASGSASARWPNPTLDGAIVVERALTPGPWEFRLGAGVHGYLIGAEGLLAPSVVPEPVAAVVFLPRQPLVMRLSASGSYLWFTDAGAWNHGWTARVGLVAGGAF